MVAIPILCTRPSSNKKIKTYPKGNLSEIATSQEWISPKSQARDKVSAHVVGKMLDGNHSDAEIDRLLPRLMAGVDGGM